MSRRNESAVSRLRLRLLPSPLLSTLLFLAWLMLNESASAGHLLLALVLALVLPWWSNRFRPERVRLRNGGTVAVMTVGSVTEADLFFPTAPTFRARKRR